MGITACIMMIKFNIQLAAHIIEPMMGHAWKYAAAQLQRIKIMQFRNFQIIIAARCC